VIKEQLEQLGLEQRDLAAAAEVTESYVSQLLTRKKLPPAPDRTNIYDKMGKLLKLPGGKLSKLAVNRDIPSAHPRQAHHIVIPVQLFLDEIKSSVGFSDGPRTSVPARLPFWNGIVGCPTKPVNREEP
jgi:transcriptional regulator with XRE-family HTH domain